MSGQEQGAFLIPFQPIEDETTHIAHCAYVESKCGFVEEQDFGVGQESAHDVHLLTQTGRKVRRFRVHPIFQPDHFQQGFDALVGFLRRDAVELREHPQVLAHGQQTIARRLAARHHVDLRAHGLGFSVDILSSNASPARGRGEKRGEDFDQRRLASAVRA